MRANEMNRDELAAFLETDAGRAFLKELDSHWEECMEPMVRYGFISAAAGGTAVLITHGNMLEFGGVAEEVRLLQMNGVEVPIGEK